MRRMLRRHAGHVLQPYPTTFEDRYPEVFTALSALLWDVPEPAILSFGCSDGSEVRSLRRWFPRARIIGLDPNPQMLREARAHLALNPDRGISYIEANSTDALGDMQFDAILAMAVFRHGRLETEAPDRCDDVLPFVQFDKEVTAMHRHLRPGGWLSVWNGHFRFRDTTVAPHYQARTLTFTREVPLTLLYGRDNRRIDDEPYAEVLFRKREVSAGQE